MGGITAEAIEDMRSQWRNNPAMPAYQRLLFDEICNMANASRSPAQPEGVTDAWHPIETAPKDGTKIDLWAIFANGPRRIADAVWDKEFEDWDLDGFRVHQYSKPLPVVTHWQPPPPPPVALRSKP